MKKPSSPQVVAFTACALALSGARAAVTFAEDFRRYSDHAPGIVRTEGIGVDNDPIWTGTAALNVRLAKDSPLWTDPIAIPSGDFTLAFRYRFLNASAKSPGFLDIVFASGERQWKVRLATDGLAGRPRESPLANGAWEEVGFVAKGDRLAVLRAPARAFEPWAELRPPFRPKSFNVVAAGGRHFALTDVRVTDGEALPSRPAAAHFAAFASREQPRTGGRVAAGETLALNPAPRAGVRLVLGATNRTATLRVKLADGSARNYPVAVQDYAVALPVDLLGIPRGKTQTLTDARIAVGKDIVQYVRPKLNAFMSSYSIEPQGVDVVRDWAALPAASRHALCLDLVRTRDRVELWVDGSYAGTLAETAGPRAFRSAELAPDAGVRYWPREDKSPADGAFVPLDFAANPRAKAFASATPLGGLRPGPAALGGYPMRVAAPIDSADVAICHQAMGNWALEVEEYHGRSPLDGYPSAVHYRVPAAPYCRAGILFALDPDPAKDAILTLRLGRYMVNGSGGNLSAAVTYDFTKGVPDWCRKVGEEERNGVRVPVWFGDFALDLGPVVDLASGDYLDFDVSGKTWENFQQMDNSIKPDPSSRSAFNLFGVTLRRADFALAVEELTPGNVFTADEPVRGMTLRVTALANGAKGRLVWRIGDQDGRNAATNAMPFALGSAGDTRRIPVDFGKATPAGFYTCDIDVCAADGERLFTHSARFAVLPPAGRSVPVRESPFATWWFDCHGSPGDGELGFPILSKAGIAKCSWRRPTREEAEKWGVLCTGNLSALSERDFEMNADGVTGHFKAAGATDSEARFVAHIRSQMEKQVFADHLLVWHESGPKSGVPEELLGLPVPAPTARDLLQAAYVNEIGRIMRKHFPAIKIQVGNSSAAMGAASKPLRNGARGEYYDCLGMETPAQVVKPERRTEVGLLGMLASQDVASRLAGRKIPLNGAWEFVYRADRDMGEELQAQWHARDVLISLAHGFFLISPGILFDCSNGYYNGLWGGSGLLRRAPFLYPKRAYVAYAVLTKVLDGVTFVRSRETGSPTVYALEFKRRDGKTVTALWCARGEADFETEIPAGGAARVGMYGERAALAAGKATLSAGGRPVYVVSGRPLGELRPAGRRFSQDAALAQRATTVAALDRADGVSLAPDPTVASAGHSFFPLMKPAGFSCAAVSDDERGACLEVRLTDGAAANGSPYYTHYTTLRFANPIPISGEPELLGVWVKGNSNGGQIRFEITDAEGEVFKNVSSGSGWGCDIMDWPGNLAVDFDGWNFVYTPLRRTDLVPTHSPGPVAEQWVSSGGNKRIDYPISLTAITVGMNRLPTTLFGFAENPAPAAIRLRDVGAVDAERPALPK